MKRILLGAALLSAAALPAAADITLKVPADAASEEWTLTVYSIDNLASAQRPTDLVPTVSEKIVFSGNEAVIPLQPVPSQYTVSNDKAQVPGEIFASPGDEIIAEAVPSERHGYDFKVSGTPLMDGIADLQSVLQPLVERYIDLSMQKSAGQEVSDAELEAIPVAVETLMQNYFENNPESPASLFALLNVNDPVLFAQLFDQITPAQKESMLYPIVEAQRIMLEREVANSMTQGGLVGNTAPDFTLLDLAGKSVSLSSLQGKWVVVDFWGSWCGWCIRGIPEMKEMYAKYSDRLEIVGVDCGDTEQQWREAVAKYELPWVNLYDGQQPTVPNLYGVQGFPTKIIVSPEGYVVKAYTGEDPEFYKTVETLLK